MTSMQTVLIPHRSQLLELHQTSDALLSTVNTAAEALLHDAAVQNADSPYDYGCLYFPSRPCWCPVNGLTAKECAGRITSLAVGPFAIQNNTIGFSAAYTQDGSLQAGFIRTAVLNDACTTVLGPELRHRLDDLVTDCCSHYKDFAIQCRVFMAADVMLSSTDSSLPAAAYWELYTTKWIRTV